MITLINDVKYSVRQLSKNPGFSVTALIVLALAIGGTTAMFTLVNALLLRPLPVKNPNQLVRLYAKENKPDGSYRAFSYPNMMDIRQSNDIFSDVTGFTITLLGITEGDVTRRTGEMGIRKALGACPWDVARPILQEALTLAAIGVAIGLPIALALVQLLRSIVYGIKPYDPLTMIIAAALMIFVAALAAWIPAQRAARIDPMEALRYE